MNLIAIVALILGLILVGLVAWVLLRLVGDQKKSQVLESQMNEMRRDLLNLSTTQAQSTTKMETIAGTVATRLEAVTTALKDGVKDSAQITSKLTAESQAAMSETHEVLGGQPSARAVVAHRGRPRTFARLAVDEHRRRA